MGNVAAAAASVRACLTSPTKPRRAILSPLELSMASHAMLHLYRTRHYTAHRRPDIRSIHVRLPWAVRSVYPLPNGCIGTTTRASSLLRMRRCSILIRLVTHRCIAPLFILGALLRLLLPSTGTLLRHMRLDGVDRLWLVHFLVHAPLHIVIMCNLLDSSSQFSTCERNKSDQRCMRPSTLLPVPPQGYTPSSRRSVQRCRSKPLWSLCWKAEQGSARPYEVYRTSQCNRL